jgi:enoyl-CoA hydratase/carnithine racemase
MGEVALANEVLYEKRDHIAYVTINRPEKRNAANAAVQNGLGDAWEEVNRDRDVSIVILTGAGTESFCAGGDLRDNLARARGELEAEESVGPLGERGSPRGYGGIQNVFKPVIAAVNGYAAGGGFGLALSCDIRLCSENAKFGASEVRWSHMAGGQAYILPRTIPLGWAMWFCMTGQFVDADTAFRIGIVQGVYPQAQLMDEATKLAQTIRANGQIVIEQTKQFIYNSLDMPLSQARKMERMYYQKIRQSPNYDEGSAAFVERRRPDYENEPTGANPKG